MTERAYFGCTDEARELRDRIKGTAKALREAEGERDALRDALASS